MSLRGALELTNNNELEVKMETGTFSGVFAPLDPPVLFQLADWTAAERFVEAHAKRVNHGTTIVMMVYVG